MRDFVDARDGASRAFASYCSRYWPAWCVLGVANCVMAVVCVWRRGSLVTRTNEPSVRGLAPLGMRAYRPWRRSRNTRLGRSASRGIRPRPVSDRAFQMIPPGFGAPFHRSPGSSADSYSFRSRFSATSDALDPPPPFSRFDASVFRRAGRTRSGRDRVSRRAWDGHFRFFTRRVTTRARASSLSPPYSVLLFFQAYAASRILRLGAAPCSSGKM